MADPYVKKAEGVFFGLAGSTALKASDLVYFDGTDWERADADVMGTFAEAMVCNNVSAGERVALCTRGIVVDTDAPFTQGDQYYLTAPAGTPAAANYTATRPTVAGNIRQLLGFGLSTEELRVEVKMPYELPMSYNLTSNVAAESGIQIDTTTVGNFLATHMNGDDEDVGATFAVPQNVIGAPEIAYLFTLPEAVGGATDFDILVSGAASGEQWDATTVDSTLASVDVTTAGGADGITRVDCTTGFDAAGVIEPDNVIGFRATYDGCQTDVIAVLALHIVWLVV